MMNLYIMIIYRFHNYLRKNSNKTIQFQKVKLYNNNGRKIVKYYVNYLQRAHQPLKKLIIIVITACCATCTLIYMVFHRICRVCIKAPTVMARAYQFIGMLPVSMCYTGSPCGTLKCALLTFIILSDVSANCIPYVNMFCHTFCMMSALERHLFFYVYPR